MILLFCCIGLLVLFWLYCEVRRPRNYPPGPNWLPLVGNVKSLASLSKKLGGQHKAFSKLSADYKTDILGLKVGRDLVVVVLRAPLIKTVLLSEAFQARPNGIYARLRCLGEINGIVATEGEQWATQSKFLQRHLRNLGLGKAGMDGMIAEELEEILKVCDGRHMQSSELLAPAVLNVLWRLVAGERLMDKCLRKFLKLFQKRLEAVNISGGLLTTFPFLRFVCPEATGYSILCKFAALIEEFLKVVINEHNEKWTEGREDDFIYAYISEKKKTKDPGFTDKQLVMVLMDLFMAGAQSTSDTVVFALMMMILHPDIQEKVQKVLDEFGAKPPSYKERQLVPYVEAVLMESQRCYHVTHLTGPRRALWDTELGGYNIPKNTTVLMSNYSIHQDVETWGDPENFRPERFLDENGALINEKMTLFFNIGKRKCIGEALTKNCIFTFFAGLLKNYTIATKEGEDAPTGEPISGSTLMPEAHSVLFIRRT